MPLSKHALERNPLRWTVLASVLLLWQILWAKATQERQEFIHITAPGYRLPGEVKAETQAASYSTSAIKVRGKKCVYLLAFLTLTYFGTQLEKGAARSGLNQLTIKTIPSQTCPQTNLILTTPQLRLSFQVILGCALYIQPIQMVSHGSPTNVPGNLRLSTSILEAGIWEQSSTDILIEDIKR